MGVEWVCFGRGHFVPEILQKKLAPMHSSNITVKVLSFYIDLACFVQK